MSFPLPDGSRKGGNFSQTKHSLSPLYIKVRGNLKEKKRKEKKRKEKKRKEKKRKEKKRKEKKRKEKKRKEKKRKEKKRKEKKRKKKERKKKRKKKIIKRPMHCQAGLNLFTLSFPQPFTEMAVFL